MDGLINLWELDLDLDREALQQGIIRGCVEMVSPPEREMFLSTLRLSKVSGYLTTPRLRTLFRIQLTRLTVAREPAEISELLVQTAILGFVPDEVTHQQTESRYDGT